MILTSGACGYQAILATAYAFTQDITRHATLTFHLFIIACALFLHVYITTLGQYLVDNSHGILTWTDLSLFGLTILQIASVGCIPCEPGRYTDLKPVYTRAIAAAIVKQDDARTHHGSVNPSNRGGGAERANMVAEHASSMLSQVIHGWIVPVIWSMSSTKQVDIHDLPGLRRSLRTQDTVRDVLAYSGVKISAERWGVTAAFLWEVWVPQWRTVIQGE